jgi:hypothetical protein
LPAFPDGAFITLVVVNEKNFLLEEWWELEM